MNGIYEVTGSTPVWSITPFFDSRLLLATLSRGSCWREVVEAHGGRYLV